MSTSTVSKHRRPVCMSRQAKANSRRAGDTPTRRPTEPTYKIRYRRFLPVLLFHLDLHFGHGFRHSQGHFGFSLEFLLPGEEIHVVEGLRLFLRRVSVGVGRALLALGKETRSRYSPVAPTVPQQRRLLLP